MPRKEPLSLREGIFSHAYGNLQSFNNFILRLEKTFDESVNDGRAERHNLVAKHFGAEVIEEIRAKYLVKCVSHDDIYDAFAALWTAERIIAGKELE